MTDEKEWTTHLPVIEIKGSTFADTHVTADGKPFPWPIYGAKWEMNLETGYPRLTFSIDAKRIIIDNTWPFEEPDSA